MKSEVVQKSDSEEDVHENSRRTERGTLIKKLRIEFLKSVILLLRRLSELLMKSLI